MCVQRYKSYLHTRVTLYNMTYLQPILSHVIIIIILYIRVMTKRYDMYYIVIIHYYY